MSTNNLHILEVTETDWSLQHPLSCRPNLLDCPFHAATKCLMVESPPEAPGRWAIEFARSGQLVPSEIQQVEVS
jgi:hypothetical protein